MWLLAVSYGLGQVGAQIETQLPAEERKAWERIGRSIATIESGGFATGTAVLLDSSGMFLAHRSVLMANRVSGKLRSGETVTLRLIFTDEPTQLSLLQADRWNQPNMLPVVVTDGKSLLGRPMLAALPTGLIRGEFVSMDRAGVVRPSLRYVPLSEIRFETPDQRFGGSMVFSYDGKLTGVLGASLELMQQGGSAANLSRQLSNTESSLRDRTALPNQKFGPGTMTIGYSVGPEILARVVEGFRSPSHRPIHPSIGCFFRDANGEGALIEAVLPNSPSAKGGMRVGDVIVKANDTPIGGPTDLAVFLFRQKPGSTISLTARRGQTSSILTIVVGRAE